jgi:hypothetical protein
MHNRSVFKGPTIDDYTVPAAHYEMAVIAWMEACSPKRPTLAAAADTAPKEEQDGNTSSDGVQSDRDYRLKKVGECYEWLDKVIKWETFLLDARIGMRVQTGLETLKWFKNKLEQAV